MPCAPAAMQRRAAPVTLGMPIGRVLRTRATLLRFTLSLVMHLQLHAQETWAIARVSSSVDAVPAKPKPQSSLTGSYIRRQREVVGLSLRKVAEMSGVSAAVLREIEEGLR